MPVNSFAELMRIALRPKDYILTRDDVDYLDRPSNPFLKMMGIYDSRKMDKLSTETLMSAYRDVAIIYKKHGKDIMPEAIDGYLRFLQKIEMYLKLSRQVPDWKLRALFTKESNYRRFF